jgi:hypothetical protein
MPSAFAALEDELSQACDGVFGETFEFRPQVAAPGGGRRAPDPDRAVRPVTGIHESAPFKSTEFGTEARGSLPARMTRVSLSIDDREFASGQKPTRLDRFRRAKDGMLYEAGPPELDDEGRWRIPVTQLGVES